MGGEQGLKMALDKHTFPVLTSLLFSTSSQNPPRAQDSEPAAAAVQCAKGLKMQNNAEETGT